MNAATSEVTADHANVLRSIMNYHTTLPKPCPDPAQLKIFNGGRYRLSKDGRLKGGGGTLFRASCWERCR